MYLTRILAVSTICLVTALSSHAQDQPSTGKVEAMQMVPAQAALKEQLDGKKLQAGTAFHAILAKKVRLKDGTQLPNGTVLVGQIVEDDMQVAGSSKMALRFTSATLKGGQTIPIKATIIEIIKPESTAGSDYTIKPGDQMPNNWNARITKVDQTNVINGVDLHSSIASSNSGVLVSNNDKDVKLGAGSEFQLAIAADPSGSPSGSR